MRYLVAILMLGLLAGAGHAADSIVLDWEGPGTAINGLSETARAWKVSSTGDIIRLSCNKKYWALGFRTGASVAQWTEISLDYDDMQFYVLKPGCYATDSITFCVASNGDIEVKGSGFDHLYSATAVDPYIETYYQLVPDDGSLPDPAGWIAAPDFGLQGIDIPDSQALHDGICWKLWIGICVERCNTSCSYEDRGYLVVELPNQKEWVDWDTGDFVDPWSPPYIP